MYVDDGKKCFATVADKFVNPAIYPETKVFANMNTGIFSFFDEKSCNCCCSADGWSETDLVGAAVHSGLKIELKGLLSTAPTYY